MNTQLYKQFSPIIKNLSSDELKGSPALFDKLNMAESGKIRIAYAPVESINLNARVVIVGITPGRVQMIASLQEARRQLDHGSDIETVMRASKDVAAFAGPMRRNLVNLLDYIGVNKYLAVDTCEDLFGNSANLVHNTSALRYPVFVGGKNYSGTPGMTKEPLLLDQLRTHFAEEAKLLPDAVYVPLGDKVATALKYLADCNVLDYGRVLDGLPHPSGANAERIAYFMGKKSRDALSVKTDPIKIDLARERLFAQIAAMT